jgi:hypothetical protein
MSEGGDYSPGIWSGHDFSSARRNYDNHVRRSYEEAKEKNVPYSSLIPKEITTQSTHPLIIDSDVTGSMGVWPGKMFEKMPYMDHELRTEYLSEDMEVLYGATGDANTDEYPRQARPFSKGVEMKKRILELIKEGHGGGQLRESYELSALYYLHNVQMPKAVIKPILILIGDEKPYNTINKDQAKKYALVDLKRAITTQQVFDELREKYSVYLIKKPYNDNNQLSVDKFDHDEKEMFQMWEKLLDGDHVAYLNDPQRVVDTIFGILALERQRYDYFEKEIEGRQKPDQIKMVYKSLDDMRARKKSVPTKKEISGESILHTGSTGKSGGPLM